MFIISLPVTDLRWKFSYTIKIIIFEYIAVTLYNRHAVIKPY